jgi:hypothetical protein
MERRLSKEVDKKGGKNAIVYIVPRLNVMVPPEFFLLHCIILKEVISLFRYRRLLSIVLIRCYIQVLVIVPRPRCRRAYGEPDYRVLCPVSCTGRPRPVWGRPYSAGLLGDYLWGWGV